MSEKKVHPNSRIVTIYRKGSFITDAQKGSALEFVSMSKKSIGSFWENSYSKTQGSGLNFEEQKILMPAIVDCEPEDRNFRLKVAEYFAAIRTVVPYDKGRSLEIGLVHSNSESLSIKNQPLNIADYITYRHAQAHPLVAKTKAESDGNMLIEYYIFDAQEAENSQMKVNKNKDEALELYLKVKQTPEKIDMLLTLLNIDPRIFKGINSDNLKIEKLKSIAETKADDFVKAFNEKFLEELYIIQTMVNVNVLQKIGEKGKVINPETGETLGHTIEEAVSWFKDIANNSEKIVLLKARMQEGLSKPMPASAKMTR